jgi:hypothetical protein
MPALITGVPYSKVMLYWGTDQTVPLKFKVAPTAGVAGWNVQVDVLASENGPVLFSFVPTLTDAVAGAWTGTVSKAQQITYPNGPGRYFYRVRRTDAGSYWPLGSGTWTVLP